MKNLLKLTVLLLVSAAFFTSCDNDNDSVDGTFVGEYTTEIDYDNSTVEMSMSDSYSAVSDDIKTAFIDSCFAVGSATITSLGNDSVLFVDVNRTLSGIVNGSSVVFNTSDLGSVPSISVVVIDATTLDTSGKLVSDDVNLTYTFTGSGSAVYSGVIITGKIRGTIKMTAKKTAVL